MGFGMPWGGPYCLPRVVRGVVERPGTGSVPREQEPVAGDGGGGGRRGRPRGACEQLPAAGRRVPRGTVAQLRRPVGTTAHRRVGASEHQDPAVHEGTEGARAQGERGIGGRCQPVPWTGGRVDGAVEGPEVSPPPRCARPRVAVTAATTAAAVSTGTQRREHGLECRGADGYVVHESMEPFAQVVHGRPPSGSGSGRTSSANGARPRERRRFTVPGGTRSTSAACRSQRSR